METYHKETTPDDGLSDCRPILRVENAARSIDYYVQSLGFWLGWAWSNCEQRFLEPGETVPPAFALVARGSVQIMLSEQTQGAPGMWLHLDVHTVEQLDAIYAQWQLRGAKIMEPPSRRPWGMYEMRVQDLDGHVLRVSAP